MAVPHLLRLLPGGAAALGMVPVVRMRRVARRAGGPDRENAPADTLVRQLLLGAQTKLGSQDTSSIIAEQLKFV